MGANQGFVSIGKRLKWDFGFVYLVKTQFTLSSKNINVGLKPPSHYHPKPMICISYIHILVFDKYKRKINCKCSLSKKMLIVKGKLKRILTKYCTAYKILFKL